MKIVIALGGNALLRRGEPLEHDVQVRNVQRAAEAVAEIADTHRVVVTHGNGPQVGLLAMLSENCADVAPYPLDVLDAESEGMIGYLLERSLGNLLPHRETATLLTQVLVRDDDPAFAQPTKPIGPLYGKEQVPQLTLERGWTMQADGSGYRRVVPSPEPHAIVEIAAIRALLAHEMLVVCAGGGGIPVRIDPATFALHGVSAVIDKDLAAALLAIELHADVLLLLTDVDGVHDRWPDGHRIERATVDTLRAYDFAAGSMGPKVEAACRFVEATGGHAAIGALEDAGRLLTGDAGTTIKGR